jgi:hypothetical protein
MHLRLRNVQHYEVENLIFPVLPALEPVKIFADRP